MWLCAAHALKSYGSRIVVWIDWEGHFQLRFGPAEAGLGRRSGGGREGGRESARERFFGQPGVRGSRAGARAHRRARLAIIYEGTAEAGPIQGVDGDPQLTRCGALSREKEWFVSQVAVNAPAVLVTATPQHLEEGARRSLPCEQAEGATVRALRGGARHTAGGARRPESGRVGRMRAQRSRERGWDRRAGRSSGGAQRRASCGAAS